MKTLIIMALFICAGCTNRAQNQRDPRNEENPTLCTIGYIGDIKIQIGIADQPDWDKK